MWMQYVVMVVEMMMCVRRKNTAPHNTHNNGTSKFWRWPGTWRPLRKLAGRKQSLCLWFSKMIALYEQNPRTLNRNLENSRTKFPGLFLTFGSRASPIEIRMTNDRSSSIFFYREKIYLCIYLGMYCMYISRRLCMSLATLVEVCTISLKIDWKVDPRNRV